MLCYASLCVLSVLLFEIICSSGKKRIPLQGYPWLSSRKVNYLIWNFTVFVTITPSCLHCTPFSIVLLVFEIMLLTFFGRVWNMYSLSGCKSAKLWIFFASSAAPDSAIQKFSKGSLDRGVSSNFFFFSCCCLFDLNWKLLYKLSQLLACKSVLLSNIACSDIALANLETEKRLSFIKAWEESEKTKAENKYDFSELHHFCWQCFKDILHAHSYLRISDSYIISNNVQTGPKRSFPRLQHGKTARKHPLKLK